MTIVVEGREIHVNSFILSTRCKHFETAHSGNWAEGTLKASSAGSASPIRSGTTVIPIESGTTYTMMMKLLTYLYTDKVDVDTESAMGLIALADFYHLPRLRALVEDFVVRELNVEDVAHLWLCKG